MALIVSIELNNATFEDLATLVSTAGAAGADESTTIEIDEEQQVLRVIIEDPIAPDIDTSDPTFFTFFDNDTDDDEDEDFGEDFDDSRNFDGFEPDYGRHSGEIGRASCREREEHAGVAGGGEEESRQGRQGHGV